jgi:hypothetical protein
MACFEKANDLFAEKSSKTIVAETHKAIFAGFRRALRAIVRFRFSNIKELCLVESRSRLTP